MKFLEAYRFLVEDRIDNLISNNPQLTNYKDILKEIFNLFDTNTQSNSKFNKFLNWIILNPNLLQDYKPKIKDIYTSYIKYNINLQEYPTLKDLESYLNTKIDKKSLVLDSSVIKIHEDSEKIVILPLNRDAAIKYGSTSWCISKPEDTSSWNRYLIKDNKLSYFIIYKSSKTINIPEIPKDNNGMLRNFNITNVQIDLDNKLYITDTGNTVGTGLEDNNAEVVLRFMKLDKGIFKSLADLDEDKFKKLKDNNPELKSKEELKLQSLYQKWFDACKYNRLEVIKELLKDPRLDVNIKNNNGDTGFVIACINNSLEVVQELLKNPRLDVNIKDNLGYTGFIFACANNSLEVVRELLKDGRVDVNIKNNNGNTGFIRACENNRLDVVKEILKNGRVDVNIQDNNGKTGFIWACLYNRLAVVKELLKDSRVDVNIQNNYGNTGFIFACANNFLEIVRELLKDPRVDVNIQNNDGNTGFIWACSNNYHEVVRELLEDPRVDVNIQNKYGSTGFIFACLYNSLEIVRELLKDSRVDVNIKNNYGNTGYDFGNREVRKLIKKIQVK